MEAKIQGGAVLWARSTIESDIFYNKPDKWFKIWFYLVCRASHTTTKKYNRGETFIQYEWISEHTGATIDQIKKCISWLRENDMVSTARSTRGVWLKVNKYEHFQTLDHYSAGVKAPHEALEKHQRGTREALRYNKNEKNEKNDNLATTSVARENKEIVEVIKMFEIVNPTISSLYGNKTQRAAAQRLLKKWSLKQIKAVVGILPKINADRYAKGKSITPYELEKNLGHIQSYIAQHNQSNRVVQI